MSAAHYTSEQVLEFRRAARAKTPIPTLARRVGAHRTHLLRIVTGRLYKTVGEAVPIEDLVLRDKDPRKFTDDEVLAIRRAAKEKVNQYDLAREYGVSQAAIWNIITGRTYKNVGEAVTPAKKGANKKKRRFTPEQVIRIRRHFETRTITISDLAKLHKMNEQSMSDLLFGVSYSEVPNVCRRDLKPYASVRFRSLRHLDDEQLTIAKAAFAEVRAHAPTAIALATLLGCKRGPVYPWFKQGFVSPNGALLIEQVLGIPRHRLRPDLYVEPAPLALAA